MLDRLSFPQPYLSLILFAIWQFLSDGVSGASVVLGLVLAWMIPQLTRGFWPDPPFFARPWKLPPYLVIVLYDILVASVSVAASPGHFHAGQHHFPDTGNRQRRCQ